MQRASLVDWLLQIACKSNCSRFSFQVSVHVLDEFLGKTPELEFKDLQLAGVVAFWLVQKMYECDGHIQGSDVRKTYVQGIYTLGQLKKMEQRMLRALEWRLCGWTPPVQHVWEALSNGGEIFRCSLLLDTCLLDTGYRGFPTEVLGDTAILIATGRGKRSQDVLACLAWMQWAKPVLLLNWVSHRPWQVQTYSPAPLNLFRDPPPQLIRKVVISGQHAGKRSRVQAGLGGEGGPSQGSACPTCPA